MTNLNDNAPVANFMGKDISDMSRDELISTINDLGRLLRTAHADHRHTLATWSSITTIRQQEANNAGG